MKRLGTIRNAALLMLLPFRLAAATGSPELTAGDDGLTLRWGQTLLMERFWPAVERAVLETRTVNPENNLYSYTFEDVSLAEERRALHAGRGEVHLQYPWGGVRLRYLQQGHILKIRAAIDNRSDRYLADFRIRLLDLHLPDAAEAIEQHGKVRSTLDRPVAIGVPGGGGQLMALCETFYPPLHFGFGAADGERTPMLVSGGVQAEPKDALHIPRMGIPQVPPGQTLELEFSLRFADAQAHRHELLEGFHEDYRAYHAPLLDWPDRRPIGATFVMHEVSKGPEFGIDGINPRRLNSPGMDGIDAFAPYGQVMVRKSMRELAHRTVAVMKRMGGQGIILWNTEGAYEPAGHYPGSPDMQTILAPEMSDALDDYFRIIRAAGLRTGTGLRPPQIRWNPDRQQWNMSAGNVNPEVDPLKRNFKSLIPEHVPWWEVYPIAERLSARIGYAKQRWGATLFYVDTSQINIQLGVDRAWRGHVMSAHIYRKIRQDHPDVLITPEIHRGRLAYAGHVMPFSQTGYARYSPVHDQDYLRDIFPHVFGFHMLHDSGGNHFLHRSHRINEAVWGEIFAADGFGFGMNQEAIVDFNDQARDAMRRVSALARRYGTLRSDLEVLPFPYALESGKRVPTAGLVADPPGSRQLRMVTATSPDRREAMLLLAWYGWPFADGTALQPTLPGVELAGAHRRVWDIESGMLLSRNGRVEVPSSPAEMLRALIVRTAESPAPELPEGLMLALSFDHGLAPDHGEDLLREHGEAVLAPGAQGRSLLVRGGGGTASYGVIPDWTGGTLEFDLKVDQAGPEPLHLVRFRHYMDTSLALVTHQGRAALRLQSHEREAHQAHWQFTTLSPVPGPAQLRETIIPLPAGEDWRHVVLAWDAGLFRLYLDGAPAGILAPRPAMERWRDGSLLEPGLIFGDNAAGGGQARIDAAALYNWSFGAGHAAGRGVGAGRDPLPLPPDLPPAVWMWGKQPGAVDRVAVNWRRVPNGVRARDVQAVLYEKTAGGLVRMRRGNASAWLGTAVVWVHQDEEAVLAGSDALSLAPRGGADLLADFGDILAATKDYVLEVRTTAVGPAPEPYRIPLTFDLDAAPVQYW